MSDHPSSVQVGARIAVLNEHNIWSEGLIKGEEEVEGDMAVTILYDGPEGTKPEEREERLEFLERDNYKYVLLLRPQGPNLCPPWDKRLLKSWQEDGALFTSLGMQGPKGPQVMITRVGESPSNDVYENKAQQGLVFLEKGVQILELPFSGIYRVLAAGARGYWGQASKVEATFKWMRGEKIHIIVGQKYGGATWIFKENSDERPLLVAAGGGMRGNGKPPSSVMDYSGKGGEGKHPYGSGSGWQEDGVGAYSGFSPRNGAEGNGCGGFGGGGDACGGGFNGGYDQGGGWSFIDEDIAIDADEDLYGAGFNMREGFVKIILKKSEWRARINPLVDQEKRIPDLIEAAQPPPIEYMSWQGPELWDGTVNTSNMEVIKRPKDEGEQKFEVTDEIIKKLGQLHTRLCDAYHIDDDEFRISEETGLRWCRKLINHTNVDFDNEQAMELWESDGGGSNEMPKEDFCEFIETALIDHMKQMSAGAVASRIEEMIEAVVENEGNFEAEMEAMWPDVQAGAADAARHHAASKTPAKTPAAPANDDEEDYEDVEGEGDEYGDEDGAPEEDAYEEEAYEDDGGDGYEEAGDDYEDDAEYAEMMGEDGPAQELPADGAEAYEDEYEDAGEDGGEDPGDDDDYEDAGDQGDYEEDEYEEDA